MAKADKSTPEVMLMRVIRVAELLTKAETSYAENQALSNLDEDKCQKEQVAASLTKTQS